MLNCFDRNMESTNTCRTYSGLNSSLQISANSSCCIHSFINCAVSKWFHAFSLSDTFLNNLRYVWGFWHAETKVRICILQNYHFRSLIQEENRGNQFTDKTNNPDNVVGCVTRNLLRRESRGRLLDDGPAWGPRVEACRHRRKFKDKSKDFS